MKEVIWGTCFGQRPYRLELVRLDGKDPFLTILGSKKGSQYCGGGIPIQGLQDLNGICNLIDQATFLNNEIECTSVETKVNCFSFRNSAICGEVRLLDGRPFYRIKRYTNYFARGGRINPNHQHQLDPVGKGFYIQEFDFPVSSTGIEEVKEISCGIRDAIEHRLLEMVDQEEVSEVDFIGNEQVLVGGEPPWFNSDTSMETIVLSRSLFDILCERLREQPMTSDSLAISLGLTPAAGGIQLSTGSRYNPRFLERGFMLDRIRKGLGSSWHYLLTQIPQEALEESPSLCYLFEKSPPGKWLDWIKATFSNDEYSTDRWKSYHFARFEIQAFEGGIVCGIDPSLSQLRATAIRLFDLKRHFINDDSMLSNIDRLAESFVEVTGKLDYD